MRHNNRFVTGQGDWGADAARHPTDIALVRRVDAVYNLLDLHPRWELVYEDDLSAIFGRRTGQPPSRVWQSALPTSRMMERVCVSLTDWT